MIHLFCLSDDGGKAIMEILLGKILVRKQGADLRKDRLPVLGEHFLRKEGLRIGHGRKGS